MPHSCKVCRFSSDKTKKSEKQIEIETTKKITFHRFPRDTTRRQRWIEIMKLDSTKIKEKSVLCSLHFEEKYIDRSSLTNVRLRENAVPNYEEKLQMVKFFYGGNSDHRSRELFAEKFPDLPIPSSSTIQNTIRQLEKTGSLITPINNKPMNKLVPPDISDSKISTPDTILPLTSTSSTSEISSLPSISTSAPDTDPLSIPKLSYDQEVSNETEQNFDDMITIKEEPLSESYLEEADIKLEKNEKNSSNIKIVSVKVEPGLEADTISNDPDTVDSPEELNIDGNFMELWNSNISVPNEFWTVNKVMDGNKRLISIAKLHVPNSGVPVIVKQMIINQDMQIKWYVFNKEIGTMSFFSQNVFDNLMKHFDSVKVCYGGQSAVNLTIPSTCNYFADSHLNVLRHNNCKYVVEDRNPSKKICCLCAGILLQSIPTEDKTRASEDSMLWRERFKASQKEVRDLKETIEWLQKQCDDLKNNPNTTLVD